MSSSKARHNELKRKHKAYNLRKKDRLRMNISSGRKYMFQEYLVNCEDAIALMVPAGGRIYRLAHNPNVLIDLYPTSLWNYDSLTVKKVDLPDTISVGSTLEKQQAQLREYTPSFNISDAGAADPFLGRLEKAKTPQQILNFKNRKGSHIYAYDVKPEDGRMWIEPDGHISFQPFEGFQLGEHLADNFNPVPIENYLKK